MIYATFIYDTRQNKREQIDECAIEYVPRSGEVLEFTDRTFRVREVIYFLKTEEERNKYGKALVCNIILESA